MIGRLVVVWWCGPAVLKVLTRRGSGFNRGSVDGSRNVVVLALYSVSRRVGCRSPMAVIALKSLPCPCLFWSGPAYIRSFVRWCVTRSLPSIPSSSAFVIIIQ